VVEIAVVSFTNYKKGQSRSCMKAVMRYTMQDRKTIWQGQSLVSGINCTPQSAYDDFLSTKLLYHKDGGTLFYHMVQSHPKGAEVDPVTAHAAAMELAKYFDDYEVLVCTHVDREHIHSHFIINSVSLEDGKKLHMSDQQIQELHQRNDQICMQFGLPVFQKGQRQKKVRPMSIAEYHIAAKGESWKFRLINVIDDCMRYARTREEFIALMQSEGYGVRWEDTRQNITYTIPSGYKCRDDRLHDKRYLKEAMEHEFGIRQRLVDGGFEESKYAAELSEGAAYAGTGADVNGAGGDSTTVDGATSARGTSDRGGVVGAADDAQRTVSHHGGTEPQCGKAGFQANPLRHESASRYVDHGADGDSHAARTGWEAEREALFASSSQTASSAPVTGAAARTPDFTGVVGGVVELGHALERDQFNPPVKDATTVPQYHERGKKRKLAPGQKADDHEDEQTFQQTMY
jgi:hypothetical protein